MLGGVRTKHDTLWACSERFMPEEKLDKYFVANVFGLEFGRYGRLVTAQHASRMIFTLPELSPGSAVGVRWAQDRVGSSLHVIPISAAATAADMFQPNECDPESVTAANFVNPQPTTQPLLTTQASVSLGAITYLLRL